MVRQVNTEVGVFQEKSVRIKVLSQDIVHHRERERSEEAALHSPDISSRGCARVILDIAEMEEKLAGSDCVLCLAPVG